MNSDKIEDSFKDMQIDKCDNKENDKETIEEAPKILSPEVHDVFHVFASMLDIKSFMKLAMTSKEMYKRCMEDKSIKIAVDGNSLYALNKNGSVELNCHSPNVSRKHNGRYNAALRKLSCLIKLRTLEINNRSQPEDPMESQIQRYMKEIGVNKIHELIIFSDVSEWEMILAIIKDFDVKDVTIHCKITEDILRSLFQLNLERICCYFEVTVEFMLEIDSPIELICLPHINDFSKEELKNLMSKIQSGSLRCLILNVEVDWAGFHPLPYDHRGPLPEDRPLLFKKSIYNNDDATGGFYDPDYGYVPVPRGSHEYWFLHSHGGVTKCLDGAVVEIFKCDPWEYPWILRKEEDILKDLSEKRPSVVCSANHFHTFCASLNMIDPYDEGPLPEHRPLYFKASENHFWLLNEDDNLMKCSWEDDCATWKPYNPRIKETFGHLALAKYMFWKALEQVNGSKKFTFACKGLEEFNSWFINFSQLPFEYLGPLPSARPLVFERASAEMEKKLYVVLLDDRLLQCELLNFLVHIKICHYLNRPPILFSVDIVMEMLENPQQGNVDVNMPIEEFLNCLDQFKQSPSVLKKRILISDWMTDKFWYFNDAKIVWKVVWEKGRVSLFEHDLHGSPPSFMKQVFRYFAKAGKCESPFKLDLEEFNSCLEQFTVVPYDCSGPLTNDTPLAFVKNGEAMCHSWREPSIYVWFLWEGTRLTKCSRGEDTPKQVRFGDKFFVKIPPVFESKEYLKLLLQAKYIKSSRFEWFGHAGEFRAYLEDFMKLPYDYEGPLPEERPILFEKHGEWSDQFLLRADGTIIKVLFSESSVTLSSVSSHDSVPQALKSML